MKTLFSALLSYAVLSTFVLFAEQQIPGNYNDLKQSSHHCPCHQCKCLSKTEHCGCFSEKGCVCNDQSPCHLNQNDKTLEGTVKSL